MWHNIIYSPFLSSLWQLASTIQTEKQDMTIHQMWEKYPKSVVEDIIFTRLPPQIYKATY